MLRSAVPGSRLQQIGFVFSFFLLSTGLHGGQSFVTAAAESNVNQRYRIESVSVAGVEVTHLSENRLPATLRERLHSLIGGRCDLALLDRLASELRHELHLRDVIQHLSKGGTPDSVRVNFDLVQPDVAFDVSLPRLLYRSAGSFSGEAEASTRFRHNTLAAAVVSNGDELTERYTGMRARLDSEFGKASEVGKATFSLLYADYHEQWNPATSRLAATDLYRTRSEIAPELTVSPTRALAISAGASFDQLGPASSSPALHTAANAATLGVRYGHRIEGNGFQQQLSGRYNLRLATRALGSTFSYARHLLILRYEGRSGRHTAVDEVMAGAISGDAPLFDRFSLGSASTLRGWDRFAIDPAGGNRMAHNEFTYGYKIGNDRTVEGFYDVGSVWQKPASPVIAPGVKHSLGVGIRQGIFALSLAFPANAGRFEAVCMAGMNY